MKCKKTSQTSTEHDRFLTSVMTLNFYLTLNTDPHLTPPTSTSMCPLCDLSTDLHSSPDLENTDPHLTPPTEHQPLTSVLTLNFHLTPPQSRMSSNQDLRVLQSYTAVRVVWDIACMLRPCAFSVDSVHLQETSDE